MSQQIAGLDDPRSMTLEVRVSNLGAVDLYERLGFGLYLVESKESGAAIGAVAGAVLPGVGILQGAVIGAAVVNGLKSWFTAALPEYWLFVLGLLFILVIFVTMVYGPIAAMLVELFPTKIRYTSMSLPYHIGNGWFGGLLPATASAL